MKAYNIGMVTIFINAGFYITSFLDVFGTMNNTSNAFFNIMSMMQNPIFSFAGVSIRGVDAIAITLALSTIVVLNTNPVTDRGISYGLFSIVFWGSFLVASPCLLSIDFPGISLFYGIYFFACSIIFVMAFIQMSSGGQTSHV